MNSIDVRHGAGDILVTFSSTLFSEKLRLLCTELQSAVPDAVCSIVTERRTAFLRSRDERRWLVSVPSRVCGTVQLEILHRRELTSVEPPAQLRDVMRVVHRF
jgi:hypothetical protein